MGLRLATLAAAISLCAVPSSFAQAGVEGSWTGFYLEWTPNADLFEYVCQENNFASELLVGAAQSVDRASRIVP
jgi:hypothetical protein